MPAPRREFLALAAAAGIACIPRAQAKEEEVTANEDLMREHGILRRALLVYEEAARRLLREPARVPPGPLLRTARVFRDFGEDYHERKLEEQYIFPAVRKLKGPAAAYPDTLQQQHDRGRELTNYVMRVAGGPSIAGVHAEPLARALREFNLMYQHHTAREDTIVFTAWKESLSGRAYKEMGERFEDIEKKTFGHDGFDDAAAQMARIESEMGIADIARFTVAKPPAV